MLFIFFLLLIILVISIPYFFKDQIVEKVIQKLGEVKYAFVTGDYAMGKDTGIIDLVLVGKIDKKILQKCVDRAEELIHRKVRTLVLNDKEYEELKKTLTPEKSIWLWQG